MGKKTARLALAACLASVILFSLAGASEAATKSCGNGFHAGNIRAAGVTCGEARKVVREYGMRQACGGTPCTFRKVGFRWRCESPRPFQNRCRGTKPTADGQKRAFVGWRFTGGHDG